MLKFKCANAVSKDQDNFLKYSFTGGEASFWWVKYSSEGKTEVSTYISLLFLLS